MLLRSCLLLLGLLLLPHLISADNPVGPVKSGGHLVATGQLVRPAGTVLSFPGRPVDLVLSADGKTLFIKDNAGVQIVDSATMKISQKLAFPQDKGGGSMHGIALSADGKRLFATTSGNTLAEAEVDEKGKKSEAVKWKWSRSLTLPGPAGKGASYPTGIALTKDGSRAYVCLSRNNSLAIVDLKKGILDREIAVGIAPYAVLLSADEKSAFVSNWGGRTPTKDDKTALSSGTPVVIDDRGIAKSGTVGRVDLTKYRMVDAIETGLHPAGMVLSKDGKSLFVANANSDTVTLLTTSDPRAAGQLAIVQNLIVRPEPDLPFGSGTNALCLSPDGKILFAANGGNNAVAQIALDGTAATTMSVKGYIPAGWYPGAVTCDDKTLFIANVKGEGSRQKSPKALGFSVYSYTGTVNRVGFPDAKTLATMTEQVKADGRIPELLRERERGDKDTKPVPIPARVGEPSLIEHVIYVIKENRTYDQVFGDLPQGNGEPKLCVYPREVSPNHHALAEKYVLLDNFYCNGVLSADGHSWVTEGNVTDHLEKAFGGFTRSYTYGDDPLTYSSSGFIWDAVLLAGKSFRNYGELRETDPVPAKATFKEIWDDFKSGKGAIRFKHKMHIDTLARYSSPDYPGWNMNISDQQRMSVFLREFKDFEKKGTFPNFVTVFLPQDHASGTSPGMPTLKAHMADNDLALGQLVEAISKSKFWKKTAIFVIEDDPQNGFDHVDGHRSICLVISPYTKRKTVVSKFYNQTSVLHTMERILGVPSLNQLDGLAPIMKECFTSEADFSTYTAIVPKQAFDELNQPLKKLKGKDLEMAQLSMKQDMSKPDRIDEDAFNRILWHALKPHEPYPVEWAGAHGRGLGRLKLRLAQGRVRAD
jgi:DNA-binding beta-propeller fold protein YncE